MTLKLFFASLLILASSVGLAQTPFRPQRVKPTPVPHIDRNARFRGLNQKTSIKMADYQGKVVVLALWASWCPACREVVTALESVHKDLGSRGVAVIALSTEPQQEEKEVRRVLSYTNITYQTGWISTISADNLMAGQEVLPQVFVIKDGVILKRFEGWDPMKTLTPLRESLEKLLDQKSATLEPGSPATVARETSRREK